MWTARSSSTNTRADHEYATKPPAPPAGGFPIPLHSLLHTDIAELVDHEPSVDIAGIGYEVPIGE